MTRAIQFKPRGRAVAICAALGLALPATASAFFSWGHNYMGAGLNEEVVAGWNYWAYDYAHKHNGGYVGRIYTKQTGEWCEDWLAGTVEFISDPSTCGYGGLYVHLKWRYESGADSYIYLEASG